MSPNPPIMLPPEVLRSDVPQAADPAPVRVLVVDDVEANLVAMRALMADMGVAAVTAGSGPAALELLLEHDVALALLDVQMPGMDGYALAELMRGSERTRGVPIIFLTAGQMQARGTFRGYEAGAVDYLYKPLDEHVLRSKVGTFVALHRQRRTIAEQAAQLARLAQANSQMLAALSHDIRTPLAVLAMNAELLLQRSESPSLTKAASRQKSAMSVLHRQVDHLLSLAQLPNLDLKARPASIDLAALASQRWQLGDAAPSSRAEFQADGDTGGWWDPALLADAIDTLIRQAELHCDGTAVQLQVDGHARGSVRLRVGFPRVLDESVAAQLLGGGAPLGGTLSVVGTGLKSAERIARAHGGSLVASSTPREGTCIELLLPRGEGPGPG